MFWNIQAELLKEMKQAWRLGDGSLSVRFQRAGAFLFEEEYLLVYLEISPIWRRPTATALLKPLLK